MNIKKTVFICFLLLSPLLSFSQVSVTSYSIYAFGISVPVNKSFSTELKTFANKENIEKINIELSGFYHFNASDYHRFSAGLGFGLNPISGENAKITIPVAIEIYPLQTFKNLSLLFELAPEIYFEDDVKLRHLWGIRYTLEKKQ